MADGPHRLKYIATVWGVSILVWETGGLLLGRVRLSTSEQLLTGIFIALCVAIWLLADIASNARYLFVLTVGNSIKNGSLDADNPLASDKPDA